MTDNEITKALECCLSSNDLIACWKCPAVKLDICCDGCSKISNGIVNKVVDLINRQKAEIERLKDYNENLITANTALSNEILDIRAETIKEFAEKLTDRICDSIDRSLDNPNGNDYYITDVYTDIDNLTKEMTAGKEDEGK